MGNKHRLNKLLLVAIAMAMLSVVIVFAKYIYNISTLDGAMTSKEFYFTTDITGDDYMVYETSDNIYKFSDVQSCNFDLFGGGTHTITVSVRNYEDELRVTASKITYTIAPDKDSNKLVSITDGEKSITADDELTLKASDEINKVAKKDYTLTIGGNGSYEEGTKVKVEINSTSPYKKTIELNFTLYNTDTYMSYEVKDSAGSPYAELVIMANSLGDSTSQTTFQPTIKWDTSQLFIDNTNVLTYTYDAQNAFKQQTGMIGGEMQISQYLKSKQSESIYFFKKDESKVYNRELTKIIDYNGNYTIDISDLGTASTTQNNQNKEEKDNNEKTD